MTTASPEPLLLPKGVRLARRNEIPTSNAEALARLGDAAITTGYKRHEGGETFSSYFEANIHSNRIFETFRKLAFALLPEVAAPIIGLKDEDAIFGPYTDRTFALAVFEPHIDLLQNDGFLEFGITFQHRGKVEEIFVTSAKYFKIWSNQPDLVAGVFKDCGVPQMDDLQFIDEFPMVSKSIKANGKAAWPGVFDAIKQEFGRLPAAMPDQ